TVPVADADLQKYAGVYRNITPANALVRPFTEILNMSRVSAGRGKLVVSGNDFLPTAPHIFRRFDRDEPSLAFLEDGGHVYKVSGLYAAEKEPTWRVIAMAIVGATIVLGALFAIVMTPFWLIAGFRGRLANRGGWLVRFLPLASILTMATTFGLTIYAVA